VTKGSELPLTRHPAMTEAYNSFKLTIPSSSVIDRYIYIYIYIYLLYICCLFVCVRACVCVLYAFGRPLADFDETGLDGSGRVRDSY
jgi:hypothetical protein